MCERDQDLLVKGEPLAGFAFEETILDEVLAQEEPVFAVLPVLVLDDRRGLKLERERRLGQSGLAGDELGGGARGHVEDDELICANSQDDVDIELVFRN